MKRGNLNKFKTSRWHTLCGLIGATLLALTTAANATDWRFHVTPYVWATNIGVDASLDGREVVDKEISVGDLMDDLEAIYQLRFQAQHGELSLMIDLFDVTLADEVNDLALPGGAGQADITAEVGMTLLDVAAIYDPKGDFQGFAVLSGARFINERAEIDATLGLSSGTVSPQSYDTDEWLTDALFGVRYGKRFSRHWSTQMQADLSFGGTDYTWSVGPSLSYSFGKMNCFGITAGYRSMTIDFVDEDGIDSQMSMSGPMLSFRTSF